jgi:hypothetical protein
MSDADKIICPSCGQDMSEPPRKGFKNKDCPQCGQGLPKPKVNPVWFDMKTQAVTAADKILFNMQSKTIDALMRFARVVEPWLADAACNRKFGEKSNELYQECERIRPLIRAAQAGEADAERDIEALKGKP